MLGYDGSKPTWTHPEGPVVATAAPQPRRRFGRRWRKLVESVELENGIGLAEADAGGQARVVLPSRGRPDSKLEHETLGGIGCVGSAAAGVVSPHHGKSAAHFVGRPGFRIFGFGFGFRFGLTWPEF